MSMKSEKCGERILDKEFLLAEGAVGRYACFHQMSQMAHNLSVSMQHEMGLSKKRQSNPKTTRMFKSMEWKTFRFLILNRAGRIAWEDGIKILYLTFNKATKKLYDRIANYLNIEKLEEAA